MALPIGILLFVLGLVACVAWWQAVFIFLQGVVAFSLLLWGLVAILIGISERKAKRELQAALHDGEAAPVGKVSKVPEEKTGPAAS